MWLGQVKPWLHLLYAFALSWAQFPTILHTRNWPGELSILNSPIDSVQNVHVLDDWTAAFEPVPVWFPDKPLWSAVGAEVQSDDLLLLYNVLEIRSAKSEGGKKGSKWWKFAEGSSSRWLYEKSFLSVLAFMAAHVFLIPPLFDLWRYQAFVLCVQIFLFVMFVVWALHFRTPLGHQWNDVGLRREKRRNNTKLPINVSRVVLKLMSLIIKTYLGCKLKVMKVSYKNYNTSLFSSPQNYSVHWKGVSFDQNPGVLEWPWRQ